MSPPQPSLGETMWEEVMRETLKEGPALGVPMQEKTMKIPVLVEAADVGTARHQWQMCERGGALA
jgi:hypothetical protein